MAAILKIEIERVPWRLVGIVAALEGVTVAILPYVATLEADQPISKPPEAGFLLGYIGTLVAVTLVNLFGRRAWSRLPIGSLKIHRPLVISLWGGLFLALIFLFQAVFAFPETTVVNTMLRAAAALACSTLIVLLAYRPAVRWWPAAAVTFSADGATMRVVETSVVTLVVSVALFEAIALPFIELVRQVETYRFAAGLMLGTIAGALASTAVISLYNTLARLFPRCRLFFAVVPVEKA